MKLHRFMVDNETLGTTTLSPIFQIGIAYHSGDGEIVSASAHVLPDMVNADPSTLSWGDGQPAWKEQLETAHMVGLDTVEEALNDCIKQLYKLDKRVKAALQDGDTEWWANPPSFDLSMLDAQCKATPWQHWQKMCFKTARKYLNLPRPESVSHDAQDDAVQQLTSLLKGLK